MIQEKNLPDPENLYPVRRALLSVSDKEGLIPFAQRLASLHVHIVSTGGTARALREAGLEVEEVSSTTEFPEILDGRVKTLHPAVHGGILARRNDQEDLSTLHDHNIAPIDLVVVNLYPFSETVAQLNVTMGKAVENIDIGGPTLIRAAAKNFFFVGVVTSPTDYEEVIQEMEQHHGHITMELRQDLARKAFLHTAHYDQAVSAYFQSKASVSTNGALPLHIHAPHAKTLRYGENPHQKASLHGDPTPYYEPLHGKELSYNNLIDLSAALYLIDEFATAPPTCAILKHTNPCGIATADSLQQAYANAFATDRQSPFGGIVVVNKVLDLNAAQSIDKVFTELIIAPDFEADALDFLMQKKNRRLIRSLRSPRAAEVQDIRSFPGGFLVQERDAPLPEHERFVQEVRVVTKRQPTDREWLDISFGWRVVKHVKSNAIVFVKNQATLGIGAGQMSRIDASEIALRKGEKSELDFNESVVASDAFFPFADGLVEAAKHGATAVVQPGGSIRDEEVIRAADDYNIAMIFTGKRHFRH